MDSTAIERLPFSRTARARTRRKELAALLKQSQFMLGLVKAFRGLHRDIHVLLWLAERDRLVTKYFRSVSVRKLQLGTSNNVLPGWLNTDIVVNHRAVAYLNATKHFPFEDNTFDYVMSEHMIEHVPYESAQIMLKECYRVLKPGGRVRFATPDLKVVIALHNKENAPPESFYIDWAARRFVPDIRECRDVFVINNFFQSWGHRFLYDERTLSYALQEVGFCDLQFYKPGVSHDINLQNLELHGTEIGSEEMNKFETIIVEAQKNAM